MSKKIEIINNALVVTDTDTNVVLLDVPKKYYYYRSDFLDKEQIKIVSINNETELIKAFQVIPLSEAVNSIDIAYTKSSFLTFARTNLGN